MVRAFPYTLSCCLLGAIHFAFRVLLGDVWEGVAITVGLLIIGLIIDGALMVRQMIQKAAARHGSPVHTQRL